MMAKRFSIDDDVRDVLSRSAYEGLQVRLPGQLSRPLYERVNKVLTAAGGRWNRKAGAHVFEADPKELLLGAAETGKARNLRQETQFFPTPPGIADRVARLARVEVGHRVLEPSAGTGMLIAALDRPTTYYDLVAVELDPVRSSGLKRSFSSINVRCCDFLTCGDELGRFDRIVMNPPFERGADIKHIEHALRFLRPGGRLVAICANGPRQRNRFLDAAELWIDLPSGTFKSAGTNVATAIVVIDATEGGIAL
ncbi:MAG: methyltransferase [Opitutaceae bacterium]|jgi:predicted RNA methylase